MTGVLLPDQISALSAVVLVLASFMTSAITASAGIGGGLLMLALMTYLIPIHALIPIHGLVQLGSNSGRTWVQRHNVDWKIARYFLVGGLIGAIAGAMLVVQLPKQVLQIVLGVFVLVLVWARLPMIRNPGALSVGLGGISTTFISMFAGATGPLVAVFLNKMIEQHRRIVATHGACMTAQHGLKIVAFGFVGFAFAKWIGLVFLMVLSGYLGTLAGTRIMYRSSEKALKTAFKLILTVVALDLLRRGFGIF